MPNTSGRFIVVLFALIFFLFLDSLLFTIFIQVRSSRSQLNVNSNLASSYPELKQIEGKNFAFNELKNFFSDLAVKKGAEYAFKALKISSLPPDTDFHLLGHVVGDELYKQEGVNGIKSCSEDFRNACSHSIVVGFLSEKGEQALVLVSEACKQAPGGKGAYTMCYHGLGHGVLAYVGYDFLKSVELCKKTGTPEHFYEEFNQCVSGSVMEMISGGFHDKHLWEKQRKVFLKKDRPLSICYDDLVPQSAKTLCFIYLTPFLWEVVGANMASPTVTDFEKAFKLCDSLSEDDERIREACYGGFGKEFIVLAKSRDIRKIENMTDEELRNVYEWCTLAKIPLGIAACINNAASSLYWGGENNRNTVIRYCNNIVDENFRDSCISYLIGNVKFYIDDPKYNREFCLELDTKYRQSCFSKLSI